jgi:hypothetical protein
MDQNAKFDAEVLNALDDHIWIEAVNTVVELGIELEHALGRKPTCDEYCFFMARALQGTHRDLFSDVSTASVIELKAVLSRVPRKILPGTLIGVPSGEGDAFAILYLTSNTFGDAFGILKGRFRHLRTNSKFESSQRHVYSSLRPLREGRWRLLGIRPDLISMFPSNPEIYHRKSGRNLENPSIGPFGSAETANGELRNLSREEADAVGLLSGDYSQVLMEKQLVAYLQRMVTN